MIKQKVRKVKLQPSLQRTWAECYAQRITLQYRLLLQCSAQYGIPVRTHVFRLEPSYSNEGQGLTLFPLNYQMLAIVVITNAAYLYEEAQLVPPTPTAC